MAALTSQLMLCKLFYLSKPSLQFLAQQNKKIAQIIGTYL